MSRPDYASRDLSAAAHMAGIGLDPGERTSARRSFGRSGTASCTGCSDPECGFCEERQEAAIDHELDAIYRSRDETVEVLAESFRKEIPDLNGCVQKTAAEALAEVLMTLDLAWYPLVRMCVKSDLDAVRNVADLVEEIHKIVERIVENTAKRRAGVEP